MDRAPFQSLLLAELDALWRFARHLARDDHMAGDLVQATCLRALEGAASFSPRGGGMRSWLFRICHNLWRNLRRDTRREFQEAEEQSLADLLVAPTGAADTLDLAQLDWEQLDQRLKAALADLPETHRLPLLLWALEDMPYREIADVLEIPVGTVMSRLHRARAQLSAALADLGQETGFSRQTENKTAPRRVVAEEQP